MTQKAKILIAFVLIALGVAGRLLPHAWNFTPVIAIGLFAGAYLGKRYAFTVPVIAMFVSDIFLGFYDWRMNLTVYVSMALAGSLGLLLRKHKNPLTVALASVAGSTAFFLITNGAVWLFTNMYPPTLSGLTASYIAGIPFYRNAVVGDFWYTYALFGSFALLSALSKNFSAHMRKMQKVGNKIT